MDIRSVHHGHMKPDPDLPAHWSVAEAKQRLSEVLRLSAREPQPIYNRGRLVAALVDAESFAAFERWRRAADTASIGAQFETLRAALAAGAAPDGAADVPLPELARTDRPNAFTAMLDEEYPPTGGGAAAGPVAVPAGPARAAGSRRPVGRGKR